VSFPAGHPRNPLEQAVAALYAGQLNDFGFLQAFDNAPVWVPLVTQPDGRRLFHVVDAGDHGITAVFSAAERMAETRLGMLPHVVLTGRAYARDLRPNIAVILNSGIADEGLAVELAPDLIAKVARGLELVGVSAIIPPPATIPAVTAFTGVLAEVFARQAPGLRSARTAWLTYAGGRIPRLMLGLEVEGDDAVPIRTAVQQAVRSFPTPPGFDLGTLTLPPADPENPVAIWMRDHPLYFYQRAGVGASH
jgi:hypothetical protein